MVMSREAVVTPRWPGVVPRRAGKTCRPQPVAEAAPDREVRGRGSSNTKQHKTMQRIRDWRR